MSPKIRGEDVEKDGIATKSDPESSIEEFAAWKCEGKTQEPLSRKLGTWTVISLILNRSIGSGIFSSSSTVMKGTNSTGVALILWVVGALVVLAGTHVMIEFGLSLPRCVVDGVEQEVPVNGGPIVFLQYLYPRPAYRARKVVMITCIFGVAYILLGNMAGNCLSFAIRCLELTGVESGEHHSAVRGIAIAVATLTCLMNAMSFRVSLCLGHIFALVKIGILLLIIILGLCTWSGALQTRSVASENLSLPQAFDDTSRNPSGYISAFLAIIFAWDGFDQPVWILEDIRAPQRTVPRGTWTGVGLVITLFLTVNMAYMVVVPKEVQISTDNVALEFFRLTLGSGDDVQSAKVPRALQVLLAMSALGNLLAMSFTATRVKQQIAREGVLPFANCIDGNRLWHLFRRRSGFPGEDAPPGALFLLWLGTVLSIVATISSTPSSAYKLLVDLYAYSIPCFFGALLSFGMLKLRLARKGGWRKKSQSNPLLSVSSATVFLIGCAFPLAAYWVPSSDGNSSIPGVAWFVTPVVSVAVLSLGLVWFSCFAGLMAWRERTQDADPSNQKASESGMDASSES